MDKLRAMAVYVRVVNEGSFFQAARALGLSPPSVTRAVSQLESDVGTTLLTRNTRSLKLTEAGQTYYANCLDILQSVEEAAASARGAHAEPRGELKLTAPVLFGRLVVTPLLADFLDQFPQMTARTLFLDRNIDLLEEGLDVAIRVGELPDSSLIARPVGRVRQLYVAAPDYLDRQPAIEAPDDLAEHRLIHTTAVSDSAIWKFQNANQPRSVRIKPTISMNSNDSAIELCKRGWGITRALSYQVSEAIERGLLCEILPNFRLPATPVQIVYSPGRNASAKVRAFTEFAYDRLRQHPALNES